MDFGGLILLLLVVLAVLVALFHGYGSHNYFPRKVTS